MFRLTVVLLSKDQAWNVERLIDSVTREAPAAQILFVDSASTDGTPELASRYPVTVLRLGTEQPLSAAAGRFVGFGEARGDRTLFLDGDMELCAGWLDHAARVLERNPKVAVIAGATVDLPLDSVARPELPRMLGEPTIREVRYSPGGGLYRSSALRRVGSFNPFLYSEEEPELGLRLRHAGDRIVELSLPMAYHYSTARKTTRTVMARRGRNLYLGGGQILRLHRHDRVARDYMRERGFGLPPAVIIIVGALCLLADQLPVRRRWFRTWGVLVVALVASMAARNRSLEATASRILERLLWTEGTVRGLLLPPRDASSYEFSFSAFSDEARQ